LAANVYLREVNVGEDWVRLADQPLVCRATVVVMLTGVAVPRQFPTLRIAGGAPDAPGINVPANVPIVFDGVDLSELEVFVAEASVRVQVFAQSR
jgi:hypothetical protein